MLHLKVRMKAGLWLWYQGKWVISIEECPACLPARPSKCPSACFSVPDHSNGSFNLKALSGGAGYKFGVLAKIVNYMKVGSFCFQCTSTQVEP